MVLSPETLNLCHEAIGRIPVANAQQAQRLAVCLGEIEEALTEAKQAVRQADPEPD